MTDPLSTVRFIWRFLMRTRLHLIAGSPTVTLCYNSVLTHSMVTRVWFKDMSYTFNLCRLMTFMSSYFPNLEEMEGERNIFQVESVASLMTRQFGITWLKYSPIKRKNEGWRTFNYNQLALWWQDLPVWDNLIQLFPNLQFQTTLVSSVPPEWKHYCIIS